MKRYTILILTLVFLFGLSFVLENGVQSTQAQESHNATNATTPLTITGNIYMIMIYQNGKLIGEVFPDSGEVQINIKHK